MTQREKKSLVVNETVLLFAFLTENILLQAEKKHGGQRIWQWAASGPEVESGVLPGGS